MKIGMKACILLCMLLAICTAAAQNRSPLDLANAPVPSGARHIAYGSDPLQFGELRLPSTKGRRPVAPYETAARRSGDTLRTTVLTDAGHFVFIDPKSDVWPQVLKGVRRLLSMDE